MIVALMYVMNVAFFIAMMFMRVTLMQVMLMLIGVVLVIVALMYVVNVAFFVTVMFVGVALVGVVHSHPGLLSVANRPPIKKGL